LHTTSQEPRGLTLRRMTPGGRVAVLIPCRDEEPTVGGVVSAFAAALPEATVYVFDNWSTDRTAERAEAAGAVVRKVFLPGKGNVVRRMFADVEADCYVLVDGDGTYDAAAAPEMVELVRSGHDLVNVARAPAAEGAFRPGHQLGNRLLGGLLGRLFGRRMGDVLSGYKACSRRLVKSFPILSGGFEIETELIVHALELNVSAVEIQAPYRLRTPGSASKLGTWRDGVRILRAIIGLTRQSRPLAFFSVVAAVLSVAGIVLGVPLLVTFLHTHQVPRLPTAVLVTGLEILAALSLTAGLVLDTVTRGRREQRLLAFLAMPGPLVASGGAEVTPTHPPGQDARARNDASAPPALAPVEGRRSPQPFVKERRAR
jgi:Glycosyl transferase family 2